MRLTVRAEKISQCSQKILWKGPVKRDSSVDKLKGLRIEHSKSKMNARGSFSQWVGG